MGAQLTAPLKPLNTIVRRRTGVSGALNWSPLILVLGGPKLGPPDAERRQALR